jgi:hypothetical protein
VLYSSLNVCEDGNGRGPEDKHSNICVHLPEEYCRYISLSVSASG